MKTIRVGSACFIVVILALALASSPLDGVSPIAYRFTFPEPEHHWMQVEATFPDLDPGPFELRMSRASPGRYSLHDFAKNVYDVHVVGGDGRELVTARPDPHGWTVPQHGSSLTVRYKVFGDRVDGTYLGIDPSHAHINMPAVIMWGRGLDDRPSTVTFVPPAGVRWQVATQLHAGTTPFEFTAPNLQYLMDSPAEFGPVTINQFKVDDRTFRFSAHHTGTAAELTALVSDVETIVRVEGEIFGEYPVYEPGHYTFLADYLPYASGDAMEHRNSTFITSTGSIRDNRHDFLDTVAHEFFHCWNVERIRPRSLEPFDFERANISSELWIGEGFTQYYGQIALSRAGIDDLAPALQTFASFIRSVTFNPGREVRSVEEMSRMATFVDGGRPIDRTNWANTYTSYYTFGGAIALGLDLSLRGRSDNRVTLDHLMRALWKVHGKPGGARQGYVDHPYTLDDAEKQLASVSGDAAFARDFFARYIRGREAPDFARLLVPAGLVLRKANAGRAWWGDLSFERQNGVRLAAAPLANTPAYKAGLDVGDELQRVDGVRIQSASAADAVLQRHKPGDTVSIEFADRTGVTKTRTLVLAEDPRFELIPVELAGGAITPAQRAFRQSWLGR